ncbi:hypothetical protein BS50DRAFT_573281 [Corynespora cassiicola Philippines]|uniref:Uncharacterized protein n=1 Tax=Corynespora cassiicola Philippines TaxID=1448308 RepID=A0A2T2NSG3_CORCC|nr:hypothetical protein BS50DRAFT_573281 [Corynespora cassiicola Philippines]
MSFDAVNRPPPPPGTPPPEAFLPNSNIDTLTGYPDSDDDTSNNDLYADPTPPPQPQPQPQPFQYYAPRVGSATPDPHVPPGVDPRLHRRRAEKVKHDMISMFRRPRPADGTKPTSIKGVGLYTHARFVSGSALQQWESFIPLGGNWVPKSGQPEQVGGLRVELPGEVAKAYEVLEKSMSAEQQAVGKGGVNPWGRFEALDSPEMAGIGEREVVEHVRPESGSPLRGRGRGNAVRRRISFQEVRNHSTYEAGRDPRRTR